MRRPPPRLRASPSIRARTPMPKPTKSAKGKASPKASAKKPAAKAAPFSKAKAQPAPARKARPKVDPITLSVVRGVLETTQREMTLALEKTARSSVFNLAHDYSTALFNHVPEMILQGQDIPIHLGSLIPAMQAVAAYFGDDIREA